MKLDSTNYKFKKFSEKQLRELALSRNKMLLGVSMIGLLLLSVFAFLLYRAGMEKDKAKDEISKQKEIIELKNKDITDSIQYAKLFQINQQRDK